jgi:hypothetical protein
MTTTSSGIAATIEAVNRDDLLCAVRKRYPALIFSEKELGDVLERWFGCGEFDIIRSDSGEIEFRPRA